MNTVHLFLDIPVSVLYKINEYCSFNSAMNVPLRARKQKDKQRRRLMLLDAARELFMRHGYHGTTIEMITERAGVSTGTFYLYFSAKSELYKSFQHEGIDILTGMIAEAVRDRSLSTSEKVFAAARAYLDFYHLHKEYFDFIALMVLQGQDELREQESEIGRIVDEKTLEILRLIENIFIEGIRRGECREIDPFAAGMVFWAMIDGMILMQERDNLRVAGIDLEKMIQTGLSTLFDGVMTETSRKAAAHIGAFE